MITEQHITDLAISASKEMQELLLMLKVLNYIKQRNSNK